MIEAARKERELFLDGCVESLKLALPYLITLGIFSAGCYAYYKANIKNNFSDRLDQINVKENSS